MNYEAYAWFTEVVRAGSFSGAALKLRVGKSTLSEKIAALEVELGVDLLIRTTRKLSLTEAGARIFERCSRGLAEIESARDEVLMRQEIPKGMLRVTAPVDLAASGLSEMFARAIAPWPELRLEIDFTDRFVDLVGERFDLAIRAGTLEDSSLRAKRVGYSTFGIMASPAYLAGHERLRDPSELVAHRCLSFVPLGNDWELVSERGKRRVSIAPYVMSNSMLGIRSLTLQGAGLALLPSHLCLQEVRDRKLVRVLPEWNTRRSPLHLVYPRQAFVQPKIKAVLPLLEREFRALFGDN